MEYIKVKPKRFFYHYLKGKNKMSIHFNKVCHVVDNIVCKVPCETKRNERQPNLVMRGFAENLQINNGIGTLS